MKEKSKNVSTHELRTPELTICMCGKCGEEKEIACLVDGVPWCGDCFLTQMRVIDGRTGEEVL